MALLIYINPLIPAPLHNTHTGTHAEHTRMQVCFWVACLPLQSFLQSFWFRQRCSL